MNGRRDLERELEDWLEESASPMPDRLAESIAELPAPHAQAAGSARPWVGRALVATAIAATVLGIALLGPAVFERNLFIGNPSVPDVGVSAIDDVADALVVDTDPFEWTGDLAEATTEEGEPFACANTDLADRSVWFAWTAPDAGTVRVTIGSDGLVESESTMNAAIFGPFEEPPPGRPDLDDLRWCVNGLGDVYTLSERVDAGHYLVQLSAVSTSTTVASIRMVFERLSP